MAKIEEASPEQAELFLVAMDRATRVEWFQTHSLSDYKPLELNLKLDLSNGIPQNRTNYGQGGKLDASMPSTGWLFNTFWLKSSLARTK